MGFLASIFTGVGSAAFGDAITNAENYAITAYSILAGELLIILLLLAAILVWGVALA